MGKKNGGLLSPIALPITRYQFVDEPPLVRFGVQVLDVLNIQSERHHLLSSLPIGGVRSPRTRLLCLFLFHVLSYY